MFKKRITYTEQLFNKMIDGFSKRIIIFNMLLICYFNGSSQVDTINLERVIIEATKVEEDWLNTPQSVYTTEVKNKDQLAQNSLQESLLTTPSIFSLNANNRAQDLRVSIRGFGSRASFGVRGIKLVVDGIPETTTDGQGQLDNLNLGIIERIEILNNGSASLYGNASGGVININTIDEGVFSKKNQFLNLGTSFQSFNSQQHQLTVGKKFDKTSIIFHANHHQGDGFREHSEFQATNFNLRAIHQFSETSKLEGILNYSDNPTANDPGGVNLEQFTTDSRTARDTNILFNAGEDIDQAKSSIQYEKIVPEKLKFNTYGFYSNRNFFGRIPIENSGTIDLKRDFFGHGSSITLDKKWRSKYGYEFSQQKDNRQRFNNNQGAIGELSLSQYEQFRNIGLFSIHSVQTNKFDINASVRYDFNQIDIDDALLTNGDDSGSINLNDFNYSLGIAYTLNEDQKLYTSHSTSFETPTLNELSNNPDGSAFNSDLRPQNSIHFELGWKGYFQSKTQFQLATFYVKTNDELLPFELASAPGRTFFGNSGSTERLGLELFAIHPLSNKVTVSTNWAFNDFTFDEFMIDEEVFNENFLPGLPKYNGTLQADINLNDQLNIFAQNQFIGRIYTDSSNSEFQSDKSITNLSIKYQIKKDGILIAPYLGSNNLFQTNYTDNIRINAFGGRFYESAPDEFYYVGLRVNF